MKEKIQSSTLFLMELILSILFFAVASAVCLQIFAESHTLSKSSQELSFAVNEVSGAAEMVCASDSPRAAGQLIAGVYPGADVSETDVSGVDVSGADLFVYYDSDFEPIASGSSAVAAYAMEVAITTEDGMMQAEITYQRLAVDGNEPVYSLTAEHYTGVRE